MSGGFSIGWDVCNGTDVGTNTGSSIGTSVPASGSAHTLGSFVQLIASTAADACFIGISVFNNSTGGTVGEQSVNIAVGGSGSEQVIISNLMCEQSLSNRTYVTYLFPIAIPAGTRISAQNQCATTGSSCDVMLWLFDGSFTQSEGYAGVDSMGFVSATTLGTTITASGSTNTKGSFTTLVASTAKDYYSLSVFFDSLEATATAANFLCDIAVGAASSEQVIIPNISITVASTTQCCWPMLIGPYPIQIPSGTRVSARVQCSTASGKLGVVAYGVYV